MDVVVIGAGMAGLNAARELLRAAREFVVLEARQRIGGRVFTMRDERVPVPLELGAEYLHGEATHTRELAREAGLVVCSVDGEHWRSDGRSLKPLDYAFRRIGRVLSQLDEKRTPDRSFAEFLAERRNRGPRRRADFELATAFVRGFHAADPRLVSERWVAAAGNPGDPEEGRQARVLSGYDRIAEWLARDLGGRIRLGTVVRSIEWSERGVRVRAQAPDGLLEIEARAAIVTLPIGVLRLSDGAFGAVRFEPELPSTHRRALEHLEPGVILRATLLLNEPLWEKVPASRLPSGRKLHRLSFLHPADSPFSVFWTLHPLQLPVLVAWAGGPPALELVRAGAAAFRDMLHSELARHFGMTRRRIEESIVTMWLHDWVSDPFSRCAYSYATVGGSEAGKALARPVGRTLFFAGEATAEESGTVEGAIASGLRAARRCARAFGRRRAHSTRP